MNYIMNKLFLTIVMIIVAFVFVVVTLIAKQNEEKQKRILEMRKSILNENNPNNRNVVLTSAHIEDFISHLIWGVEELPQHNAGKSPYEQDYPEIKITNYADKLSVISAGKGVWHYGKKC